MSRHYGFLVLLCAVLFQLTATTPLQDTESDTLESNPRDQNVPPPTTTDSDRTEVTTFQEDAELLAYLQDDTNDTEVERYKSNIFSIPKRQYQERENIVDSRTTKNRSITGKWVTNVLGELLWEFSPLSEDNAECSTQSEVYKQRLKNFTLWAVQSKYTFLLLI